MSREQRKSILIYSFSGAIIVFLIVFAGVKNHNRPVEELDVDVLDQEGVYFTNDREVIELITAQQTDFLVGTEMGDLDPKVLERRVEENPFVKDAEVYRDLEGVLKVKVIQSKPIARVFTNGEKDQYIDSDGRVLPVNAKHTARVPLLETEFDFPWLENMDETTYGTQVFELLQYIEQDDFWKAQIAHVLVKSNGELELYPQVTKQKIEFGKPGDFEDKFSKLMTFYKEILPVKGWNSYERVNVKFKNQIICE